jgi:hypothetical protein
MTVLTSSMKSHYHIRRYRYLHHANSYSTKEATHQNHRNVNCSTLDDSRSDADDAYKLNRLASAEFVEYEIHSKRADNTASIKKTIRRYVLVRFDK